MYEALAITAAADTATCLAYAAHWVDASLRRFGLSSADEVAVVVGPHSSLGVKLAKALGAQVTMLGHAPAQREEARRLGADAFITLTGPESFAAHAGRFRALLYAAPEAAAETQDNTGYDELLASDGLMLRLGAQAGSAPLAAAAAVA